MPTQDHAHWDKRKAQAGSRFAKYASRLRDPGARLGELRGMTDKAEARREQYAEHEKTPERLISELPQSTSRLEKMERRLRRWTGKGAGLNIPGKGQGSDGLAPMSRIAQLADLLPQTQTLHDPGYPLGAPHDDSDNDPAQAFLARYRKDREDDDASRARHSRPSPKRMDAFGKQVEDFFARSEQRRRKNTKKNQRATPEEMKAFNIKAAAFLARWKNKAQEQDPSKLATQAEKQDFNAKAAAFMGRWKRPSDPDNRGRKKAKDQNDQDKRYRITVSNLDQDKNAHSESHKQDPNRLQPPQDGAFAGFQNLKREPRPDPKLGPAPKPKEKPPQDPQYRIAIDKAEDQHNALEHGPKKPPDPNRLQPPQHQPNYAQLSPRGSPLPPNLANPSLPGGLIGNPMSNPHLRLPKPPHLNPHLSPQHLTPPPPNPGKPPGGPR